jgi:hypothetical protein
MRNKKLDQLVLQLENYLECWKQINYFLNLARSKKFTPEEENQFLEIKSVIAQELELILSSVDITYPTKEEVLNLVSGAPSIRYLSEMNEGALRGIENQWHKIFIGFQSLLGQLKVQQRQLEGESPLGSIFGKKK